MNTTKQGASNHHISKCGTLLAFLILHASLKYSGVVQGAKEEVDELALAFKPEELIGNDDSSNSYLSSPFQTQGEWRQPCFYLPPSYYYDATPHFFDYFNGEIPGTIKRNFNPWGGKRSHLADYFHQRREYGPGSVLNDFHRSPEMSKKGSFNPWGGKRDATSSRSSKNEYPPARRVPFNPWGGR